MISQSILHCNKISNHEVRYVIAKTKIPSYKHKYIRDEKQFNSKAFKESAAALLVSRVFAMDDPKDKHDGFKQIFTKCLNEPPP